MKNLKAGNTPSVSINYPPDSPQSGPLTPTEHPVPKTRSCRNPLPLFKTLKRMKKSLNSSESKAPKKEYLRCKLIRGCKKCIRYLSKSTDPHKSNKFKKTAGKIKEIWQKITKFYEKNMDTLEVFSKTDTMLVNEVYKSYNSKFCSEFFRNSSVRKIFRLYVKLLFVDLDILRLEKEFNFSCCGEDIHDEACAETWKELEKYILSDMIDEVIKKKKDKKFDKENIRTKEEIEENLTNNLSDDKEVRNFSLMGFLELQPKWIQRYYLQDLHII